MGFRDDAGVHGLELLNYGGNKRLCWEGPRGLMTRSTLTGRSTTEARGDYDHNPGYRGGAGLLWRCLCSCRDVDGGLCLPQ
jgi:hypothetical protein